MAKPIKQTPALSGNDARSFLRNMESTKGKVISGEEARRINENYKKLASMVTIVR